MRHRKDTVDGYRRWDAADKRDAVDNGYERGKREWGGYGIVTGWWFFHLFMSDL
jgi:hypothetical protein